MPFKEAFKLALQSLWANKLRSILTLFGVIIGVASVIMVVTLTNGAKKFVTEKINTYGAAVVTISKMPQTFITTEEYLSYQKRKDITYDDYRAVLSDCKSCVSVAANAQRHRQGRVRNPVHHRHEHSRLDLDDAANDESQYRGGALLHRTRGRAQCPCRRCRLRHCRQCPWPRRPAGQRDPRGWRALHGHWRRREPGQDVRPEHGQLGRNPPQHISPRIRCSHQLDDLCEYGRRRSGYGRGFRRAARDYARAPPSCAGSTGCFLHRFERDVSKSAGKYSRTTLAPWWRPSPPSRW